MRCRVPFLIVLIGFCLGCGETPAGTVDATVPETDAAPAFDLQDAPLPTSDASRPLRPGDLIKAPGRAAVYYYAADGRRYVFPNEDTYFSWYPTLDGIRTIPAAALDAILPGRNVTIRPGTWLVKITTDPKVYALTRQGTLHWVQSEALATTLYGADWSRRVRDVAHAFFVNYQVGAAIETPRHPDGTLLGYAGSATRFVLADGRRRAITPTAFAANRFQERFVVLTTITYPEGPALTEHEPALSDPILSP